MSLGMQAQLGIDVSAPVSHGFEFISSSLAWRGSVVDTSGMRGSRSQLASRARNVAAMAAGTIAMLPNLDELARLLPWIVSNAANGSTFRPGERAKTRAVTIDKVARVYTYAGCAVDRAVFSAAAGGPFELRLDVIGASETSSNVPPSLGYAAGSPLMFNDATLTIAGNTLDAHTFTLSVDNHLQPAYSGAATPSSLIALDRTVRLSCTCAFDEASAAALTAPLGGVSAALRLALNGRSITFAMPALQVTPTSPPIPGRRQFLATIEGVARRTDAEPELSIELS